MARGMMSQTRQRIDEASRDDRILNAPLTVVMKAYGLSYPNAGRAIKTANDRVRKANTLKMVEKRGEQDSLVNTLRTAEENYPGITAGATAARNHAVLGQKHSLTRERVRQIAEAVKSLAAILGKTEATIASMAAKGKLPQTQRDELEHSITASS